MTDVRVGDIVHYVLEPGLYPLMRMPTHRPAIVVQKGMGENRDFLELHVFVTGIAHSMALASHSLDGEPGTWHHLDELDDDALVTPPSIDPEMVEWEDGDIEGFSLSERPPGDPTDPLARAPAELRQLPR